MRKLLELEQQGADLFFGEISFDIRDLMRRDRNGYGYINIIRLTDIPVSYTHLIDILRVIGVI